MTEPVRQGMLDLPYESEWCLDDDPQHALHAIVAVRSLEPRTRRRWPRKRSAHASAARSL